MGENKHRRHETAQHIQVTVRLFTGLFTGSDFQIPEDPPICEDHENAATITNWMSDHVGNPSVPTRLHCRPHRPRAKATLLIHRHCRQSFTSPYRSRMSRESGETRGTRIDCAGNEHIGPQLAKDLPFSSLAALQRPVEYHMRDTRAGQHT